MPPEAQCSVTPVLWGERFQLVSMVGKTLNVCGELPEESVIDGRVFKEVIEGTRQQTEFKGMQVFDFRPKAAQWFAGNHLPRSRDTSQGFVRRWLIFDFTRVVPESQRIIEFHKILIAEEREAIAAWAVQGLKRLTRQRDYTQPASHKMRLNQVKRANNTVAAFLQSSDRVFVSPGARAPARAVFDQYTDYMKNVSRGWSVTYERFIQMLDDLGHDCPTYTDGVGMLQQEVVGVEVRQSILPQKSKI